MDANRFDTLAKALTGTRSRRSAIGSVVASGVLGALGLGRGETASVAAQGGGVCVVDFQAIVRQGPSAARSLAPGGSPGTLRGYLRFSLSESGNLEDADLLLSDGTSLPVVGQATGFEFQARINLGQGQALVAVGVGEQEVTRCLGRLDGTTTSTEIGDLGEWHAVAGVQNIPAGTGQAGGGGNRPASGSNGSSGSGGSGNRPASGTSGTGSASSGSSSATDQQSTGNRSNNGSSSSEDDANSEIALACPEGQTRCDGACVNLRTDVVNCGQCGVTCASELGAGSCINGICGCPEGSTRCNDICVNTDRDPLNCGRCGNTCPAGQECRNGSCSGGETSCADGETRCSGACFNTTSDVFNCGECGRICALDEECTGGQCISIRDVDADADADDAAVGDNANTDAITDDEGNECEAGETLCSTVCTDLQTDVVNCGACGTICASVEECVGGTCTPIATAVCAEGQVRCDGTCRDAITNFGSEGLSCPGGGGAPTECPAGRVLCNGACFPEGACQPTECQPGWGYCYGVCRDFQNDPGYCGGCSTPCTGGAYCSAGRCNYCSSSLTPCGNDCVDTQTDLDNCGACGNRCGTQCIDGRCTEVGPSPVQTCAKAGEKCAPGVDRPCCPGHECVAGTCYPEIGTGDYPCGRKFSDPNRCGNVCVYLLTDPNFCGDCYTRCPPGAECRDGLCSFSSVAASDGQTLAPTDAEPEPEPAAIAPEPEPEPEPPVSSCPEGQTDCGGVCSDISFDEYNCGSCGFVCGSDSVCERGVCIQNAPPPSEPEEDVVVEAVTEADVVTESAPEEDIVTDIAPEDVAESAPEEVAPACVDAGGSCDPASPGGCCSGVCNEDGTCA